MPIGPIVKADRRSNEENKNRDRKRLAIEFKEEADAYSEAYKTIEKPGLTIPQISVLFVLAAFSCELYFKALIYWNMTDEEFENGFVYEHSLKKLFDKLPEEIKKRIKTNWNRAEEGIVRIDDNFEFWRYYPEYLDRSSDFSTSCELSDKLQKLTMDIR